MRPLLFVTLALGVLIALFYALAPSRDTPLNLTPAATLAVLPAPSPGTQAPREAAGEAPAAAPTPVASAAVSRDAEPPGVKVFRLEVSAEGLASGPAVIRVRQGERIALSIASSIADELHLHGYDRHLPLRAGETARLDLVTELSGRFSYELHQQHREIGVLEVLPR